MLGEENPSTEEAMELLLAGAQPLGIALDTIQQTQFSRYYGMLMTWNQQVNLTAVTQWDQVQTVHFLDSLTVALALPPEVLKGGCVLDVGSGGGFPGLPLKIAFPSLCLGLIESRGKKASFLRYVVDWLGLSNVAVYQGRAEALAHAPDLREGFDAVLARSLGKMHLLAELTLPFVRVGGRLIAQKKGDIASEIDNAEEAFMVLGGGQAEIQWLNHPVLPDPRALVVVLKVAATPEKYPRRPGMPAKYPLGTPALGHTDEAGGRR